MYEGGRTADGFPIVTLPDCSKFTNIKDEDFVRVMTYLVRIPRWVHVGGHVRVKGKRSNVTNANNGQSNYCGSEYLIYLKVSHMYIIMRIKYFTEVESNYFLHLWPNDLYSCILPFFPQHTCMYGFYAKILFHQHFGSDIIVKATLFPCLHPLHPTDRAGVDTCKQGFMWTHSCNTHTEHLLLSCDVTNKVIVNEV